VRAEREHLEWVMCGERFQEFLWEASGHGERPIPLGVITREGYQGGMDPELAAFLDRT
jgi:hypothetical protein